MINQKFVPGPDRLTQDVCQVVINILIQQFAGSLVLMVEFSTFAFFN